MDYSYLNQPQVSTHFVWTSSWGRTLKKHNSESVIESIGPIIFKMLDGPIQELNRRTDPISTVTVFDVTPKKIVGDESIYSDEIMKNFLVDIIQMVSNRYPTALIRLKPKRVYSTKDSSSCRDFVQAQVPRIKILQWNSDIVDLIESSDLVICIPFSSPALISKHLGIPTIIYVPSSEFNLCESHEDIPVIQGQIKLCHFLGKFER